MTVVSPALCIRQCPLTINYAQVLENNTYAVLFSGSGDAFGTRLPNEIFTLSGMQGNGGDICFTSDVLGTNQLNCEIAYINNTGNHAEIWVSVPLVTTNSSSNTIYVWYGSKSGTLTQPAVGSSFGQYAVWTAVTPTSSVVAALHFNQTGTPTSWLDSTSNANHAVNTGSATATTGQIYNAASFNGSTQYSKIAYAANLSVSNLTLQCWHQQTTATMDATAKERTQYHG